MPYISSLERLAMEEGEQRGEQRGELKGLAIAVRIKFGSAGEDYLRELQSRADFDWVARLEAELFAAASLDDLRAKVG